MDLPAVDQYGAFGWFVQTLDSVEVCDQWSGVLWCAMVGPGDELVLSHLTDIARIPQVLQSLWGRVIVVTLGVNHCFL